MNNVAFAIIGILLLTAAGIGALVFESSRRGSALAHPGAAATTSAPLASSSPGGEQYPF